ncbi:GerAB/ArcD/ProY family transporter [Paenibacillus gansuensis]|uniref:GerAB/ArcD/ProY family transporter n=1 Tax=Paenibacillus gansuensis TaxID=306542 RepID=A0ABW5PJ14_9BACL
MGPALKAAKQDRWISMLAGGLIGVCVGLLMAKISLMYPDKTLVQFSEIIFGKWLGILPWNIPKNCGYLIFFRSSWWGFHFLCSL